MQKNTGNITAKALEGLDRSRQAKIIRGLAMMNFLLAVATMCISVEMRIPFWAQAIAGVAGFTALLLTLETHQTR
jgi:hypothetical protein